MKTKQEKQEKYASEMRAQKKQISTTGRVGQQCRARGGESRT
jgi:hypothetical protein